MDNQNANGGFSPNPANYPGQFGSYDPNAGQQTISSGQLEAANHPPVDPVTGAVMPQANYGNALHEPEPVATPEPTPTPQEAPTEPVIPPAPEGKAPIENFIVKPNLVNLQTKSLVESQREMSADELAKANAYAAEVQRQERQAKRQKTVKRVGLYVGLGTFGLVFLGVFAFLLIEIFNTSTGGVTPGDPTGGGTTASLSVIDGYECKTTECKRINDLPDGRIIIRDNGYHLYDKQNSTTTLTAIDDQEYNSITSFTWGEKIYAVIDPISDRSGIFSISDNRMVVDYQYDQYFTDVTNNDIYGEMAWVTSQYIIAKNSAPDEYHVIDLLSGQSVLRGSARVFMHDGFFFGYETGGERRVYTKGASTAFVVATANDHIFTRDGILIVYKTQNKHARYYNSEGKEIYSTGIPFWTEINRLWGDNLLATYKGSASYYKIPASE